MGVEDKEELMQELVTSIKLFQDAVDLFDTSAADYLHINSTDLRCLTILHDRGPLLAKEVAQALGLTKGATTIALNRLVEAGYIRRCVNSADGRSFLIELTDIGQKEITVIWHPMRVQGHKHLEQYSERELRLLLRFFTQSIQLQTECLETLGAAFVETRD